MEKKFKSPDFIAKIVLAISIIIAASIIAYALLNQESNIGKSASLSNSAAAQQDSFDYDSLFDILKENASFTVGNKNADIILVEYSDFQCPFCRKWYTEVKDKFFKKYVDTGKVLFVYKDLPLTNIHENAMIFAESARCAEDQNAGEKMHDLIFDKQNKGFSGQADINTMLSWAKELSLNEESFKNCLESGKYKDAVSKSLDEAVSFGFNGTPSFIVMKKGKKPTALVGARPFSNFDEVIASLE